MNRRPLPRIFLICIAVIACAALAGAVEPDRSLPENGGPAPPAVQPWTGMSPDAPDRGLIDDFDRADGPLGADWSVQAGDIHITNMEAHGGSGLSGATHNTAAGDVVEMDVACDGTTNGQYVAALLNYGGGASNILVKVQNNGGVTQFNYGACYTGVTGGGGSFGLGFFGLSQNFSSAHMRVAVDVSRTVTIDFTNVNGGALPDQQYICTGAPAAEGPAIGIGTWESGGSIDNYADGPIPVELQSFNIE